MLSRKLFDILKQQEDVVGIRADFHSSERQQIEIIKRRSAEGSRARENDNNNNKKNGGQS